MIKKTCLIAILTLLFVHCVQAQVDLKNEPWSVNEATSIGVGGYNIKDTYLSPIKYTGIGFRVMNERMKVIPWANYKYSRQQIIHVDVSSTKNPAETASDLSGFIDYSLGYHYRMEPVSKLKVLVGPSVRGLLGFVYNTRNGNNPANMKFDIDLNLSAMAIYPLTIKNYPITLRYQIDIPFMGMLFSPHYGQSYYEIFDQGNSSGVVKFSSFHNKFAARSYFSADFPIGNFTIRAGYLNSIYRTNINNIKGHIISNSFMIGLVKEFVSFGGKKLKKDNHRFRSAYY